jgi:hypothetical protein
MKTKITKINNKFHARLFDDTGKLIDEMACELKADIGIICREMLRWYDKGGGNAHSSFSRSRHILNPAGKIWWNVVDRKI